MITSNSVSSHHVPGTRDDESGMRIVPLLDYPVLDYPIRAALASNRWRTHRRIAPFSCKDCGWTTLTRKTVSGARILNHCGVRIKRYQCQQCGARHLSIRASVAEYVSILAGAARS